MCEVVYNNPMNTLGVGDPVPFGCNECGSGDVFNPVFTKGKRKKTSIKGKAINVAHKKPAPMFSMGQQLPLIVMAKRSR